MQALYCYRQKAWIINLDQIDRFLYCPDDEPHDCMICRYCGWKDVPPEEV